MTNIGVAEPDLSHFEMMRRWWSGNQDSLHVSSTGFLGRLCDELGAVSVPAVGVSLGYGPSPALNAAKVTTLSMNPSATAPGPASAGMSRAWTRRGSPPGT